MRYLNNFNTIDLVKLAITLVDDLETAKLNEAKSILSYVDDIFLEIVHFRKISKDQLSLWLTQYK